MLNVVAKRRRLSRSDVVREAVAQYGTNEGIADAASGPYGAWVDVIGTVNPGVRQPNQTTGEQFTAILRGRGRARRPR
jgi:hypothetical protein